MIEKLFLFENDEIKIEAKSSHLFSGYSDEHMIISHINHFITIDYESFIFRIILQDSLNVNRICRYYILDVTQNLTKYKIQKSDENINFCNKLFDNICCNIVDMNHIKIFLNKEIENLLFK